MPDESTDLNDFSRIVSQATPSPGRLQRDALLFAAGQADGERRYRRRAGLCAALAGLSLCLAVTLAVRPAKVVEVDRVVYVTVPAEPAPAPAPLPSPSLPEPPPMAAAPSENLLDLVRRRDELLRSGEEPLPPSAPWAALPEARDEGVPALTALRLNSPSPDERNP